MLTLSLLSKNDNLLCPECGNSLLAEISEVHGGLPAKWVDGPRKFPSRDVVREGEVSYRVVSRLYCSHCHWEVDPREIEVTEVICSECFEVIAGWVAETPCGELVHLDCFEEHVEHCEAYRKEIKKC